MAIKVTALVLFVASCVLIGLAGLVYLAVQGGRTDRSPRRVAFIEAGAVFWHLVDLLWIVLFPLLYLVR